LSKKIFLVAAEASGDALGADLIRALKARDPELKLAGTGGPAMRAAGVESAIDISGLGVLGFIDGLKAYGRVIEAVEHTIAAAKADPPDVAVLIDSWGFTLRVARAFREALPQTKLVKYIGPQIWATRPGRAKTLAATVDHLICIHDFEPPFYAPYNLPCTVCGHPAIGRHKQGNPSAFRARHAIADNERVLLVLPGSRASEIRRVGPTLWRAALRLAQTRDDLRLLMVAAGSVAEAARAQAPAKNIGRALIVDESEKDDAFASAHVALAASGTVTTEVALHGTPLVIGYKLGWVTWALARAFLLKTKYATLMNVAAGKEAAPEFLQTRFNADNLVAAAARLLDDEPARQEQIRAQNAALALMGRGGPPAANVAADAVLKVITPQPGL
jgi:lipid-A-disaccharide synthase